MLASKVVLHDVQDVEGFVHATIRRSRIQLSFDERQELVAEGICIMFELAARYRPKPPSGRFSGFAAQFLPRRLGDAWHSSHPEHRYITTPEGKRAWRYEPAPVSLEGELEGNGRGNVEGSNRASRIELTARPIAEFVKLSA